MINEEFKKTLWDTANKLRGSVSAAEYTSTRYCSDSTRELALTPYLFGEYHTRRLVLATWVRQNGV